MTAGEASDTVLTALIAQYSQAIDEWTDDHFEAENALTITLNGIGGYELYVPKRIRSITSVATVDPYGTVTTQDLTIFRIEQSLTSGGVRQFQLSGDEDKITIAPGRFLQGWGWTRGGLWGSEWPNGTGTVQVTGNFNYVTAPDDIKRAVGLLVWDHIRLNGPDVKEATRWSTADATYDISTSTPTGIPEVDQLISRYSRPRRNQFMVA